MALTLINGYSNEFLDSDRTTNVYFSDVDAKNRIRSLNINEL